MLVGRPFDPQLRGDLCHVRLDGPVGDEEAIRDGLVGEVGTAESRGDLVHTEWATTPRCGGWADYRWRLDDDRMIIDLVDSNAPAVDAVWFETNPWVRID
jgi:hypothetical protein